MDVNMYAFVDVNISRRIRFIAVSSRTFLFQLELTFELCIWFKGNSHLFLPSGLLCGLMWTLATYCWFLANNYLSAVITFPIANAVSTLSPDGQVDWSIDMNGVCSPPLVLRGLNLYMSQWWWRKFWIVIWCLDVAMHDLTVEIYFFIFFF